MTSAESEFYHQLNDQILYLCKSLPESVQSNALLLFLGDQRGSLGENMDFFRHYAKPSWSIVYHLVELGYRRHKLDVKDTKHAIEAHAMAMFLHGIDDHLNDGQLDLNHLTLLIRSQAWLLMQNALVRLADGIEDGHRIISGFIEEYYATIDISDEAISFGEYCHLFRSQMATAYIVPGLLIKKFEPGNIFYSDFLSAYGSFGIAWRLLDDLNDIRQDIADSRHSAVYCLLSDELKTQWNDTRRDQITPPSGILEILEHILAGGMIEVIVAKINSELAAAAQLVSKLGLNGLSEEFRLMAKPFEPAVWNRDC